MIAEVESEYRETPMMKYKHISTGGVELFFPLDIANVLAAVELAQAGVLRHIPPGLVEIYRSAQADTLRSIAAAFGLVREET